MPPPSHRLCDEVQESHLYLTFPLPGAIMRRTSHSRYGNDTRGDVVSTVPYSLT